VALDRGGVGALDRPNGVGLRSANRSDEAGVSLDAVASEKSSRGKIKFETPAKSLGAPCSHGAAPGLCRYAKCKNYYAG
jgi:hypothetical protein